jgi:D-glycero-alpha-D-manno-heptose-7-phosphate kinase
LGGVNVIDFRRDDGVTITPVNIESSFQDTFQKSLLLFYTGLTRSASTILRNQMQEMTTNNKKSQVVTQMADMTMDFSKAIISCDILSIGKMLNEAWILKKYTSQEITNEVVDGMYEKALEAGAWGGKLLGAGGGGFLLICAPEYTHVVCHLK